MHAIITKDESFRVNYTHHIYYHPAINNRQYASLVNFFLFLCLQTLTRYDITYLDYPLLGLSLRYLYLGMYHGYYLAVTNFTINNDCLVNGQLGMCPLLIERVILLVSYYFRIGLNLRR
jgi:hypothetical protein